MKTQDQDLSPEWVERVQAAAAAGTALQLRGGGSKAFYGHTVAAEPFELRGHCGIVNYQPTELAITVRSATPLTTLNATLGEARQMLPCDPPLFGGEATVGGAVASGLSGPGRPWRGAVRDLVLGCRIINGRGEALRFGGEVMKNVAGYDVSRLMTGALGTLGIITEVSFKVLPRPEMEQTRVLEASQAEALSELSRWRGLPLPISAAAWLQGRLYLRLSGAAAGVEQAASRIGGEPGPADFWSALRDQQHAFFAQELPLWRLSLPPATPALTDHDNLLVDWAGAQRWLYSEAPASSIRAAATAAGGHASLFRGGDSETAVFTPPGPAQLQLQKRLKNAFDPQGLFNPGRMYREI